MTVVLGLLAAVLYGIGDFAGGIGVRLVQRANSAVTVLLHSYPVGAVLMAALLPAVPRPPRRAGAALRDARRRCPGWSASRSCTSSW